MDIVQEIIQDLIEKTISATDEEFDPPAAINKRVVDGHGNTSAGGNSSNEFTELETNDDRVGPCDEIQDQGQEKIKDSNLFTSVSVFDTRVNAIDTGTCFSDTNPQISISVSQWQNLEAEKHQSVCQLNEIEASSDSQHVDLKDRICPGGVKNDPAGAANNTEDVHLSNDDIFVPDQSTSEETIVSSTNQLPKRNDMQSQTVMTCQQELHSHSEGPEEDNTQLYESQSARSEVGLEIYSALYENSAELAKYTTLHLWKLLSDKDNVCSIMQDKNTFAEYVELLQQTIDLYSKNFNEGKTCIGEELVTNVLGVVSNLSTNSYVCLNEELWVELLTKCLKAFESNSSLQCLVLICLHNFSLSESGYGSIQTSEHLQLLLHELGDEFDENANDIVKRLASEEWKCSKKRKIENTIAEP